MPTNLPPSKALCLLIHQAYREQKTSFPREDPSQRAAATFGLSALHSSHRLGPTVHQNKQPGNVLLRIGR